MANFSWASVSAAAAVEGFKDGGKRTASGVVLESIDRQLELFADAKLEGRRWFRSSATHTAFCVRYANKKLVLKDGETDLAVKTPDFPAAMDFIKGEINKGVYDEQLKQLEALNEVKRAKMGETRKANKLAKEKEADKKPK